MKKKPVLVVMAAGMGSRYGGLKQIDPVGSQGEAILDFSLYDAGKAGFETAVIIIKRAIEKDFMETVGQRLKRCPMEIRYAFQELDKGLPPGFSVPRDRVKPWGTSHAVLCAGKAIGGAPFAVINADDYYGSSAFRAVYDFLRGEEDSDICRCCMAGYELGKTVTENGAVTRGICAVDQEGYLTRIVETPNIRKDPDGIRFTGDGGRTWTPLAEDTVVSMNLWGLPSGVLDQLEAGFPGFLAEKVPGDPQKAEYLLPVSVGSLLKAGRIRVKVLPSADTWYGVTYAADKPRVAAALREMTAAGKYPHGLWK